MSNLSELLPAGGGGKNVEFVASGTLPNGKSVILNSNGTVTAVGESAVSENIPASSEAVFNTATAIHISVTFDPTNSGKFIIAYRDYGNSNYGTAIVGTVSGTSLSFGSEYIFSASTCLYMSVAFDTNTANKFIIAYADYGNSAYGKVIVGTISGTSLSFGTAAVFNAKTTNYISAEFDPNTAGKFVAIYTDAGGSNYGRSVVGTVSGTSLSFGSARSVFNAGNTDYNSIAFDPNTANKFIVAFKDSAAQGSARVGTLSGTELSFGTSVKFNSATTIHISATFDHKTANKFIIAYRDYGNSGYGTAIVGTVSGTSLSFGTSAVFNSAVSTANSAAFDPNTANKFIIAYLNHGNSASGTAIVGTVSGTSLSFGTAVVLNQGGTTETVASFDPLNSGKFIVVYNDTGNSGYGTSILGQLAATETNLTSTNFLGITDAAISSGASGSVTIKGGLKSGLSSLTPNSIYYTQGDGSISTVSTSPAVRIGKALSSTTLNLEFSS